MFEISMVAINGLTSVLQPRQKDEDKSKGDKFKDKEEKEKEKEKIKGLSSVLGKSYTLNTVKDSNRGTLSP